MSLNRHILAAAIALIVTVVPGAWYLGSRPSEDELNDTLKSRLAICRSLRRRTS